MTSADARKRLLTRRAELLGNLAEIADQLDDPRPQDWDDAAVERQDDEVLEALGQSDQAELRRIDAALGRIAEGSWGVCAKCGEEIAPRRLELLPDTPFCAACAV